uniref:Uncharacterized protein n=1 Tax=Panagrellus redivivus TaxID=6233 RepID=A0A7E4UWW4_PANRE
MKLTKTTCNTTLWLDKARFSSVAMPKRTTTQGPRPMNVVGRATTPKKEEGDSSSSEVRRLMRDLLLHPRGPVEF